MARPSRPSAARASAGDGRVRVLFIGGAGRSGSTLLGLLLGKLPGFAFHGELRWLWRLVGDPARLCGCRVPHARCPFWLDVGERAFGGWNGADLAGIVADEERVVRWRYMPTLPRGRVPGLGLQDAYERYARASTVLYRATRDAARASILVDSSKDPPFGFFLAGLPSVDLRVVHLVRDSRAVAYSLGREVRRPDVVGRDVSMPRHRPAAAALRWNLWNGCFDLLRLARVPTLLVRYADLAESPAPTLRRIVAFAGRSELAGSLDWLDAREVEIGGEHTVGGNPLGFGRGSVEIRPDERWRRGLPRGARLATTALTLPLLAYYARGHAVVRSARF